MEDRARQLIPALCAAVVLVVAVAGCGGGTSRRREIPPPSALCVYAGLPLLGPQANAGAMVTTGIRAALAQAHSRAGAFGVRLCGVGNDSDAAGVSPTLVAEAAHRAALKPSTIAYIGDLQSAATDVAGQLLSAAGIAQLALSPVTTTPAGPATLGAVAGGFPHQSTPSTALQLVPDPGQQASVAVAELRARGCTRIGTANDGSGDGQALAALVRADVSADGLTFARTDPTCVVYTGDGAQPAAPVTVVDAAGALTPTTVHVTEVATVSACTTAWARSVATATAGTYLCIAPQGSEPSQSPESAGYAAMELILDAVRRLGRRADNRAAVLRAMRATRALGSPLGPLTFTKGGEPLVSRYEVYAVTAAGGLRPVSSLAG